jgi:hypothetical protein
MRALSRFRLKLPAGFRLPSFGRLRPRDIALAPSPPFGLVACAIFLVALCAVAATIFLAGRASEGATDRRAAGEAQSFAEHSGWLATGDAFGGYIQLLRDAEDTEVRSTATPSDIRTAALRRLLELNTNRFDGLAVVDLNGVLVAASDPLMVDAPASSAFAAVRANHGNANSDIVITEAGAYVDYASVLVSETGQAWAVLVARASPDRLWQSTLAATVDEGRNVIINSLGQFAAGVPAEQVGQPWSGSEWVDGTIRARPGGVDSICSLQAIARDTQIDHGWVVASCLPASVVLASSGAVGGTLLIAVLSALAIATVAAAALWYAGRRFPSALVLEAPASAEGDSPVAPEPVVLEDPPAPSEPDLPPQTIDARSVIEAYEARNARLAVQVRDSVQARLLVASSRVEEALAMSDEDPILARAMLQRAAHELDELNEHELRAMGQDLYPDLVRLGLPAALRALRKDVADVIDVEVEAGSDADSVDVDSGRALTVERRTLLYRLALDAVTLLAEAGVESCTLALQRPDGGIWLGVKAHADHVSLPDEAFAIHRLAIQAYGGELLLDVTDESVELVAEFTAIGRPSLEASPEENEPPDADSSHLPEPTEPDEEAA